MEEYIMVSNMRCLTWDGEYLWCISWEAKAIYKIDVGPLKIEKHEQPGFSLYPIPCRDMVPINISTRENSVIDMNDHDMQGKLRMKIYDNYDKLIYPEMKIATGSLLLGVYMMTVITPNRSWSQKMIVKR